MSCLQRIAAIAFMAAIASSSGCCLFSSCATGGCGMETYYTGGCTDGGCDGCGDGPVIPCQTGAAPGGCGLGLGCIGKLLGMAGAGCNGCGETYYHGWVNDPPCCDPCDGGGNWTGAPVGGGGCDSSGGCDSCGLGGGGFGGGSVAYDPGCGAAGPVGQTFVEPGCGFAAEPTCGLAGGGCSGSGGGCGRTGFQIPGRAIYSTWTGLGGFLREFRHGFLPSCRTCNAFSITNSCSSCSAGPICGSQFEPSCGCGGGGTDVYFGGAGGGGVVGGCTSCAQHSSVPGPVLAQRPGRLPHNVVTNQIQRTHGRPPHKLVTNRLTNQLR